MRRAAFALAVSLAALAFIAPAAAQTSQGEAILSFHSEISVLPDGAMFVSEVIRVRAEGRDIRRGIHRDIPTLYGGGLHLLRRTVGFEVVEVLRDGVPEPHHTQRRPNGFRIYVGDENVFLEPGEYTYRLTYKTTRQLGFFRDHDELYWNVTGDEWRFTMDKASAAVRLPDVPADKVMPLDAYTGPRGAKGRDWKGSVGEDGIVRFEATRPLMPHEGLTICVGWPKGYVEEPTGRQRLLWRLEDNWGLFAGAVGTALVLLYFLLAWAAVGKDPPRGVIVPLFQPPMGMSPAEARFVREMGFDNKVFTAALINMAVKGFVTIEKEEDCYRIRRRSHDESALSAEEHLIADALLADQQSISLTQGNHGRISGALEATKRYLRETYETSHFVTNTRYFVPGAVAGGVVALVTAAAYSAVAAIFFAVWLGVWTVGVVVLLALVASMWRKVVRPVGSRIAALPGAVGMTLFALPFLAAEVLAFGAVTAATSLAVPIALVVLGVISAIFYWLLKAPTPLGRRLLDELDGFRMYLGVAEKDRLNLLNPPERTPELFERYLPYALALDVEQRWSEQFADVLEKAGQEPGEYRPEWYVGTTFGAFATGAFAGSLSGALGGAISSASTAPGSVSGGGGGGSSGGGGGGGGGGGW